MYAADGTPGLTAFLAFFATLFVVLALVAASRPVAQDTFQPVCHDRLCAGGHVDSLADSLGIPAGGHHLRVDSAIRPVDEFRRIGLVFVKRPGRRRGRAMLTISCDRLWA